MRMLRGSFLLFFASTIFACSSSYEPMGHHPPPTLIAHRGASTVAPENTIPAVEAAWDLGADAVEVDVRISGDDRLVVIHDRNTARTTGAHLKVAKSSYEKLKTLDAGSWFDPSFSSARIPLLDEVLDHVPPDKQLLIEFKSGRGSISLLKEVLKQREVIPPFAIISFDRQVVAEAKKELPEIPSYWILSNASPIAPNIRKAKEVELNGLNVKHGNFSSGKRVDKVREEGLHLLSWTVNDPERARELKEMGVQGIITDEVKAVKVALEKEEQE